MRRVHTLADVVTWRLCLGCGACAYLCPDKVQLLDFPEEGIRPVVRPGQTEDPDCLRVCPAIRTDFSRGSGSTGDLPVPAGDSPDGLTRLSISRRSGGPDAFSRQWGPVLELWEGYASDPEIRFKGSSGGALTALSLYCLERLGMHGVLHTGQAPADPIRNRTRLSRTRTELLAATGSRYSPASVCDGLARVEQAPAPCVVIGRPVEIAALRKAEKLRPQLADHVGLALSFFCAESPATSGTLALLDKLGVPPEALQDLRYRGCGWPGNFAPVRRGESNPCHAMTYRESWAFLQAYRPWSVQLWPDGTGELADISCGDPWYVEPDGKNPGFSLIVVRTERGRRIIRGAMEAGYLDLRPAERWKLERSQAGLLKKKAAVWGRLLAMRLLGLPTPRFDGAHLFPCWCQLPFGEKLKSVFGTLRRIVTRRLYRPLQLDFATAVPVEAALDSVIESRINNGYIS